jgi:hypothetical protein
LYVEDGGWRMDNGMGWDGRIEDDGMMDGWMDAPEIKKNKRWGRLILFGFGGSLSSVRMKNREQAK